MVGSSRHHSLRVGKGIEEIDSQSTRVRKRTIQNENDIVLEKINTGLILFVGVISTVYLIAVVVYSVVLVIHRQQSLIELSKTLIFAALLLAIGLGCLCWVRRRLREAARKKNPWRL